MPIDPITVAGAIGTGASIADSFLNRRANAEANEANRKFQREENERDRYIAEQNTLRAREWALSDWDKVNQYNAPTQQMQRLREAGLNPALIYGKGADNTANMVKGSEQYQMKGTAPHVTPNFHNLAGAFQPLQNAIVSKYQIDNLNAKTSLINQQKDNAIIDNAIKVSQSKIAGLEADKRARLFDTAMETAKQQLENMRIEGAGKKQQIKESEWRMMQGNREYLLSKAKNKADIAKINAETAMEVFKREGLGPKELAIKQQTINQMLKDGTLKNLDIELRNMGLQPHDPFYFRFIPQMIAKRGLEGKKIETSDKFTPKY